MDSHLGHSSSESKGAEETEDPFQSRGKVSVQSCESQAPPEDSEEEDQQPRQEGLLHQHAHKESQRCLKGEEGSRWSTVRPESSEA